MKSGDGNSMFPNLSSVMLNLLCLPHSSATVERVFSAVNRMKTKIRNRLSTSKRLVEKNTCFNFTVPSEMVRMMNSDIYKNKSDNADENEEEML